MQYAPWRQFLPMELRHTRHEYVSRARHRSYILWLVLEKDREKMETSKQKMITEQ